MLIRGAENANGLACLLRRQGAASFGQGSAMEYDLVVIGSGPAGQKGAIAAAKLGKRVAVVDRREMTGGVCVHTGTIPSKTLREAILYLSGFRQRTFYGKNYVVSDRISARDL